MFAKNANNSKSSNSFINNDGLKLNPPYSLSAATSASSELHKPRQSQSASSSPTASATKKSDEAATTTKAKMGGALKLGAIKKPQQQQQSKQEHRPIGIFIFYNL
jgi:hypothetical protein